MSPKKSSVRKRNRMKSDAPGERPTRSREFAAKVLSNLPRENGFYFYNSIGNPTGAVACSFGEFCEDVKASPPEIIEFHLSRGDFENWIKYIGDEELASQIGLLRSQNLSRDELFHAFVSAIQDRQISLQRAAS